MMGEPFVSKTCEGERCWCGQPAVRKVGEEFAFDEPDPGRHNLTSYICAEHYAQLMGPLGAEHVGLQSIPEPLSTGLDAILSKSDDEIMDAELFQLFGKRGPTFTRNEMLKAANYWFEQGKNHILMLSAAKERAEPLLDEGLVEQFTTIIREELGWQFQRPTSRNVARKLVAALSIPRLEAGRLWLWRNFVDDRPEYWAFDNPFPCHGRHGDPMALGEPCGWALFKQSENGRPDIPISEVEARMSSASAPDGLPLVERMRDLPRLIELQREGTIDDLRDEGWNAGLERAAAMVSAALTELEEKSE